MPKIVHITTVPQSFRFMQGQLGYMTNRGYEVAGISSPGRLPPAIAGKADFDFYPVEMPRAITPMQDLVALGAIYRRLRELEPDIVHGHTPKGGLLAMIASAMAKIPVRVYHLRGLPMTTAVGAKRLLLKTTETISCGLADHVVAVGNSMKQIVVDEGICPREKISVLGSGSGNGVDAQERFNPENVSLATRESLRDEVGIPEEARVVGYVGRLVRDKGIVELIDAWSRLRRCHPDLWLLVVGPFEERDAIPQSTKEKLLNDPRIVLTGYRQDTPVLYTQMDLLALPTYREGFPNTPLEAAAMELPVVATKIGPCREAVAAGETGLLVDVGDEKALANAIHRYLSDDELRRQHGLAGRRRALMKFAPGDHWQELELIYQQLLKQAGLR